MFSSDFLCDHPAVCFSLDLIGSFSVDTVFLVITWQLVWMRLAVFLWKVVFLVVVFWFFLLSSCISSVVMHFDYSSEVKPG